VSLLRGMIAPMRRALRRNPERTSIHSTAFSLLSKPCRCSHYRNEDVTNGRPHSACAVFLPAMPEAELAKLFERFFTSDAIYLGDSATISQLTAVTSMACAQYGWRV
jgi:hypothetical protein